MEPLQFIRAGERFIPVASIRDIRLQADKWTVSIWYLDGKSEAVMLDEASFKALQSSLAQRSANG